MPPVPNPGDLIARVNRDVERSLLRARNGLRYVTGTHRPKVGATPKEAVRRETGCREVTLAGYCLGGIMATLYAAGHADAPVRNLVLMATPIDFGEMGAMVAALRDGRLSAED